MTNALRGSFDIELADGTELQCLCNLYAVHQFCKDTGNDLTDLEQALTKDPLAVMPALLWAAVETSYTLNEQEIPITRKRFEIILGSSDWEPMVENIGKALSLDSGVKKKAPVRKARTPRKTST